jgi:hypothetical protein
MAGHWLRSLWLLTDFNNSSFTLAISKFIHNWVVFVAQIFTYDLLNDDEIEGACSPHGGDEMHTDSHC